MQIHYSLQPKITGRPQKGQPDPNPKQYYKQGFRSSFTTVGEFAKAVAEYGYLWSGTQYKRGIREGGNFILADTLALDIDNKDVPKPTTSQAVLKKHPLASGICLIYNSGSHTPEQPRFRVVFRLEKPVRDRREYRILFAKFWAVSAAYFEGLDPIKDEARIWYGSNSGAEYVNEEGAVDLDLLEREFQKLPEEVQIQTENEAIRRVASREELVRLGLMSEREVFAGDLETDKEIFKYCLKHLPQWEGNGSGWYEENKWILGAAVDSFGVDLAAEVLESAWGDYPRDRPLFQELQQWERNHGNPVRFGSVVTAATSSKTWTAEDQERLDELQKQGAERSGFRQRHGDVLDLDSIREAFGCSEVSTDDQLFQQLASLTTAERLREVDKAILEMLSVCKKRAHRTARARAINAFFDSPYHQSEIQSVVKRLQKELENLQFLGAKPLMGIDEILDAVDSAEDYTGYICENLIPRGATTVVGGASKVGKTSMIVGAATRAAAGLAGVNGLASQSFSHLTIFSDDQKHTDTGRYVKAAINGITEISRDEVLKRLKAANLAIYPRLTLDEDGCEQLSTLAAQRPGGLFIIDSLASTAGRLGIDENSAEIGTVLYTLREAIQFVDPSATVILIHHLAKGGTQNKSHTDSLRGSGSIAGSCDNVMTIERPTEKRNGNSVDEDMTTDRIIHLKGRTVPETKIVLRGNFVYSDTTLTSIKLDYVGTHKEYLAERMAQKEANASGVKTRGECLSDAIFDVFNFISSKKAGVEQRYVPGAKSTVSEALKVLLEEPALIVKDEATGKYRRHHEAPERLKSPYHLQQIDS